MKSNTKEIFYAWQDFLNEGEQKSNLLSESFSNNLKQDKISEIRNLIEWGDKLEHLINENVEIRLLESHYLNEGVFSAFKKAKDKVKSFFTQGWTKDKVDDDGNIVRSDLNDEESAAVQEYTSKTKAVIGVLLAVKLTGIILGSLALGIGNTSNVDPSSINNRPAIVSVAEKATNIPGATTDDFETADGVVDMPMETFIGKVQPEVVDMPMETFIGKVKETAAEHVAKQTGDSKEDILKKIQDDPECRGFEDLINTEAFKDADQRGKAIGYGLDPEGSYDLNQSNTDDRIDLSKANVAVQKIVDKASFEGLLTGQQIDSELKNSEVDVDTLNDYIKELSREQLSRLITAAKLYAIKQLKSKNPDVFKNGGNINIGQSYIEGGNKGDQDSSFSSSHNSIKGTDEAKVLYTIYNTLDASSEAYSLDQINTIGKLKTVLNQSFDNKDLSQNNSMVTQAKNDIIKFIAANVGSDDVDLDQSLDNNDSFNVDIRIMTAKLSSSRIKSNVDLFGQNAAGNKGARKLAAAERNMMPNPD